MGRPVIATDHGGSRETVVPDISGILIPPNNAKALAVALAKLTRAAPETRSAMGAQGRDHIVRSFSLARMTADTLSLYQDLLDPMR